MNYGKKGAKKRLSQLQSKTPRINRKINISIFKLILFFFIVCFLFFASIGIGVLKGIINSAPDISALDVKPEEYASYVYDINGNVMNTLVMSGSNRQEVSYEQLPEHLINAFIAIEDERFLYHNGIDIRGILRAATVGLTSGDFSEGASTITQQLIKNSIFNGGSEQTFAERLERKIQEQYLSVKLEKELSKEKILEYYLNTINLGSNTLGVQAASNKYFHKDVSELTLSESAVIASITQNPSKYNPITQPEKNAIRRKTVLSRMLDQGLITRAEYDEALNDDVYSRIQTTSSNSTSQVFSYFTDAVFDEVLNDLMEQYGYTQTQASNLLYSGGLSIFTTMDPDIQAIVDEEVNKEENYDFTEYSIEYSLDVQRSNGTVESFNTNDLKNYHNVTLNKPAFKLIFPDDASIEAAVSEFRNYVLQEGDSIKNEVITKTLQPQASMVVMDQSTGYVVALSGGRGEKTGNRVLNRATNSKRQPGSCFKVLTAFAPAIDTAGATLATTYYDAPYTAGNQTFANWWNSQYVGYANIRQGIAYSMNIVAAKALVNTVTPKLGFEYAEDFGITTLVESLQTENGTLSDIVPSLALGGLTYGVTNLEITAAYAAIENNGIYTEPILYTKVLDKDGKVILEKTPETHTVLKESTAALITAAMEDTINGDSPWKEYGITATGELCKVPNMSIAGKSGSSTNSNDLWFVGYSPYYTAGIWSGYDDSKSLGSGSYHKVIWQKVMARIHEGKEDIGFTQKNQLETAKICSKSGLLAIEGVCDSEDSNSVVYEEYSAPGTAPTDYCTRHVQVSVCKDSNHLANEFCPSSSVEKRTYLIIDANDLKDGATTDDSKYAMPSGLLSSNCEIHSSHLDDESLLDDDAFLDDDEKDATKENDSNTSTKENESNSYTSSTEESFSNSGEHFGFSFDFNNN